MSGEGALPNRHGLPMTKRLRRGFITCPVCNADGAIHDSDQPSQLVKDVWVSCSNITCGHTFKMQLSFVYTISPSAIPHDLDLPEAPAEFRRHIYPDGPPRDLPDPDQFTMFDDPDPHRGPEVPPRSCTGGPTDIAA